MNETWFKATRGHLLRPVLAAVRHEPRLHADRGAGRQRQAFFAWVEDAKKTSRATIARRDRCRGGDAPAATQPDRSSGRLTHQRTTTSATVTSDQRPHRRPRTTMPTPHPTGWRRSCIRPTTRTSARSTSCSRSSPASIGAARCRSRSGSSCKNPGVQIFSTPHQLTTSHHRARPDHDLLHGHAGDDRRVRQLVRADHDRRAGHGLPAHEQHLVLAAGGLVRAAARLDVRRRRAGLARLRRRLDALPPLSTIGPSRPGDGLRHPLDPPGRRLVDPRRDQLHHHHLQHARAGHDAAPDAAVRLVDPGDRLPAAAVAAGAGRRDHHAADRPQFRHPLLRARRAAATRSCSSTCSGSSATPRSTS